MAERFNGPYKITQDQHEPFDKVGPVFERKNEGEIVALWLKCPCGCNENQRITVNGHKNSVGASWSYSVDDGGLVTINPSIYNQRTCGAHFFIRNGMVEWC